MRRKETLRIFSYLGVPLLQVVPLVGVVGVEARRLLLLSLHESLQLQLLLPLEIKCLRLLLLLQLLLLTEVNSLGTFFVTKLMRGIFEVVVGKFVVVGKPWLTSTSFMRPWILSTTWCL